MEIMENESNHGFTTSAAKSASSGKDYFPIGSHYDTHLDHLDDFNTPASTMPHNTPELSTFTHILLPLTE